VTVDPSATPVDHVRASLDQRLRALLTHEPGTRTGEDIEDLHQMRVAVRRMRATLKAARPLLDAAWSDDLRAELGWLGGALGPVRDLDVLLLRLHREIASLPADEQNAGGVLLDALERERTTARAAMLEALTAPRYFGLLERLAETVSAPLLGRTTLVRVVFPLPFSEIAGAVPPNWRLAPLTVKVPLPV